MSAAEEPDRWYSWSSLQWHEKTPGGYRKAAVQGPPPSRYLDGLPREERVAALRALAEDGAENRQRVA